MKLPLVFAKMALYLSVPARKYFSSLCQNLLLFIQTIGFFTTFSQTSECGGGGWSVGIACFSTELSTSVVAGVLVFSSFPVYKCEKIRPQIAD